jgi:hypothetical protein
VAPLSVATVVHTSLPKLIANAGAGFYIDNYSGPGTPNTLHDNAISGNGTGLDASAVNPVDTPIDATTLPLPLKLKRVRLTSDTSQAGGKSKGVISISATFDATEVGGSVAAALSSGLVVGVTGAGLSAPETLIFPYPRCLRLSPSRIKCIGTLAEVATFRRKGKSGNTYSLRIRARDRTFKPALSTEPVDIIIALGGLDRVDQITCKLSPNQVTARCRK